MLMLPRPTRVVLCRDYGRQYGHGAGASAGFVEDDDLDGSGQQYAGGHRTQPSFEAEGEGDAQDPVAFLRQKRAQHQTAQEQIKHDTTMMKRMSKAQQQYQLRLSLKIDRTQLDSEAEQLPGVEFTAHTAEGLVFMKPNVLSSGAKKMKVPCVSIFHTAKRHTSFTPSLA